MELDVEARAGQDSGGGFDRYAGVTHDRETTGENVAVGKRAEQLGGGTQLFAARNSTSLLALATARSAIIGRKIRPIQK